MEHIDQHIYGDKIFRFENPASEHISTHISPLDYIPSTLFHQKNMFPSPEKLFTLAKNKRKETQKFLKQLRKKPPKQLDNIMMDLHREAFTSFDCLTCANCCKTTGPLFTDQDINRISKHFKMSARDFENTYLKVDEDGDKVLQQVPCTFLGADNYCSIYDVRPKACREYPHTDRKKFYQINSLTLQNVEICPAAYVIVERLKEKLLQL